MSRNANESHDHPDGDHWVKFRLSVCKLFFTRIYHSSLMCSTGIMLVGVSEQRMGKIMCLHERQERNDSARGKKWSSRNPA